VPIIILEFYLCVFHNRRGQINGMKKLISLSLCTLAVLGAIRGVSMPVLSAQDVVGFSVSLGLEADGYSPTSMGFGVRFGGDYRFGEMLSVGTSGLVVTDGVLTTLEISVNVRYYLFRDENSLIRHYNWASIFHIFVQAEGGAAVFFTEDDSVQTRLMGGLVAGSRIALSRYGSFYIEPYLGFGYPQIFSVGVMGVYRFPIRGVFW
jgi:hypothetical protein